jgi:hypothetical protein
MNDRKYEILKSIAEQTTKIKAVCKLKAGDQVKNINTACTHYGSEGTVTKTESLEDDAGYLVSYKTSNDGPTWKANDLLTKTEDQLQKVEDDDMMEIEDEDTEDELTEYKEDFFEMSVGSLRAIAHHAEQILNALETPAVKENLTESWLQGKIAITEDYMRTIHDFIMYVTENDDTVSAADRPGLWENIRKKKEKKGKKYRPAKPGDKDRPDPQQWKKLTTSKCGVCGHVTNACSCRQ